MYLEFVKLWNSTDKEIEDYVEKNGSLGIDEWKWERFIMLDEKLYAIEWESPEAVPINEKPPTIETPEVIRKEAKKMHIVIKLVQIARKFKDEWLNNKETVDTGESLKEVLIDFMKVIDIKTPLHYEPEKDIIKGKPLHLLERADLFLADVFNAALLRISPQIKIIDGETSLDFNYPCSLAQIWYALITDIIKNIPPRICKYCGEIFKPKKAWGEYCTSAHQEAAKSRRYRRNQGQTNNRGRPPKKKEKGE